MMESTRIIRALLEQGIERCPPSIRQWAMSPREMLMLLDIADGASDLQGQRGEELDRRIEILLCSVRAFDGMFGTDDEVTEPMPVAEPFDPLTTIRKEKP